MLAPSLAITPVRSSVPFDEMVRDHNSILAGYYDDQATFRNRSRRTVEFDQWYLNGWFNSCKIRDDAHPDGRQLFIWEAMDPDFGREIISDYTRGLGETDLRRRAVSRYMGSLNRAFKYVVRNPYIPAATVHLRDQVEISKKYNAIVNPVSKYDYPSQSAEEPVGDCPLVDDRLLDFLSWVHSDYLPKARNPLTAGRTLAQIVTVAERGFRFCEMEGFDTKDVDYKSGFITTHCGKASRGSGPRTRRVEMSPLMRDTLRFYQRRIREQFPFANEKPALFLSERGERLGYSCARSALRVVIKLAKRDGLILPSDMCWHSLRRSFATQYLDRHPGEIWKLLEMMGHHSRLSLIRYIRPSKQKLNEALDRILAGLTGRRAF